MKPIAVFLLCCGPLFAQALTDREKSLLDRIERLEQRVAALEKKQSPGFEPVRAEAVPLVESPPAPEASPATTLNLFLDAYYGWNFNRPAGRVNPLRAYDVTANNFSINQTGLIFERPALPAQSRRWGVRLDLMFGQATETLQGGAPNEPRPQVYRHIFQAYGTYVAPVGRGLTLDFGKWASSLGFENNYTKDQINYSRSFWFNYLPFYHAGIRATLPLNDRLTLGYWLVNGGNQTEDFNGFKSQMVQAVVRPATNLSWTIQYYNGREQRGPGQDGRTHFADTYASWNLGRLTLGGELDYAVTRGRARSPAQVVWGGAAYLRWQLSPRSYFGQRYVRLNDRGGAFSGRRQHLTDFTSTFGFRLADGFESRVEYRRDSSDAPFFAGKRSQNTATLGLLWWFGGKQGAW
ncbi:MAG: outer membrane beta-barrel protein [Bryobacteraceae bacterium]|nr:outer membrane beta-barrel protein [Bryobacteraceae bacterium]